MFKYALAKGKEGHFVLTNHITIITPKRITFISL